MSSNKTSTNEVIAILLCVIIMQTMKPPYVVAADSLAGIECPDSICFFSVEQKLSVKIPGWDVHYDTVKYRLRHLAIYDGHPKRSVSLVPDTFAAGRNVWELRNTKICYWIGCTFDQTNVMLIRQLDTTIGKVEVVYDTTQTVDGLPMIRKVLFKKKAK
ncbi:MAG: hypothetical protein JW795_03200 [Chitinivibrionales bacterium]|nr:hypothetical protein [Chitinivibrionales bacterium]